jgi:hypothetical protein
VRSDYPDRTGLGHARRRLDEIAAADDPRRRLRALLHEGMPGVPIDVGV